MSRIAFVAAAALLLTQAWAATPYKIVTADQRGTYFAIGNDLAKMVAPRAHIDLEVVPTSGSAENVKLLRHEPGVKLAIVQADVYQAFVDRERRRTPRPPGSSGRCASSCRSTTPRSTTSCAPIRS